ncbi:hypothetical protein LEP1GSC060_2579 [Leptospira weilii serovar Ranarum str. ICFT]|uniref:DUF1640 domain-containing protein n=1 Tax=Leptospira weilii serovar Ranarum str. ICFT TaxID=1218598 RepID=N1WK04_9LEPT|nr:hypothetical protein [Leptospira weilii]EMY79275.1 hypothetical protein LEP1GSC060_2579 [Leptospira weilii serovar Ranarum str. ICFT]
MSALIQKVPRRLGELLGPEGTVEFVDFLNRSFGQSHSSTIEVVTDRFERRLSEESSKLRLEMSELRSEFRSEFLKVRAEFSDLKADFADHRADIKSEISEIHKAISLQTKWILGVAIGSIGVFSIIVKF